MISKDTWVLVKDYWDGNGDGWNISFRRPLRGDDVLERERLMDMLDDFSLNEGEDSFIWILEKSQKYSRSMYRRLSFRGVTNQRMRKLWKNKLPMKLKVFLWRW